jgi:hypothetical protein
MTTFANHQRMRDRHEARAWHDSCVTEAQAVEAAQEEARRILAPWSVTLPADCCSVCGNGTKLCPCPEACGVEKAEPEPRNAKSLWAYFTDWVRGLAATWRWLRG